MRRPLSRDVSTTTAENDMTGVDWRIKGVSLTSCNCDVGCPCQFNSLPTHGHCRATMGARIDQGHFGDVKLDGLTFAVLVAWPGPIHEGKGEAQPIVDSSATPAQREAILAIISGEHTDPGATIFNVFAATFDKIHDPIFAPIDLACDVNSSTTSPRSRRAVPRAAKGRASILSGAGRTRISSICIGHNTA
jgi:hypothetical protein